METIYPDGKHVADDDDDNVVAPSLDSKSPGRDRKCADIVDDVNSIDEEITPDDDCSVDLRGEEKVSERDEVVSLSSSSKVLSPQI